MPEERDKRSQRAPEIHVPAVSEVSASLRCSHPKIGPLITARGVPAVRIGVGNHVVYRCRRAAEEARAFATQLGHDGQRTRAFLEKAGRVGRDGLNAAAALDDLRAARRVA
jgi:hypothetical protein